MRTIVVDFEAATYEDRSYRRVVGGVEERRLCPGAHPESPGLHMDGGPDIVEQGQPSASATIALVMKRAREEGQTKVLKRGRWKRGWENDGGIIHFPQWLMSEREGQNVG